MGEGEASGAKRDPRTCLPVWWDGAFGGSYPLKALVYGLLHWSHRCHCSLFGLWQTRQVHIRPWYCPADGGWHTVWYADAATVVVGQDVVGP